MARRNFRRCTCISVLSVACVSFAHADEGGQFYGLLRGRDLTPFGSLRLDMRPAHAVAIERGSIAIELDMARFTAELDDEIYLQRVREHQRHGADSGVRATPAFFVNGRIQDVSYGLQALFEAVEAELRRPLNSINRREELRQ